MNVLARRKDDFFNFELLVIFTSKVVTNAILALVTTVFVTNAKMALVTTPGDDRVKDKYKLHTIVSTNGFIFIKIKKGMYGLKQAAMLAYKNLIKNLQLDGYSPIEHTDSYWKHSKYPTIFCLCVDDFGVKYFEKQALNHLINSLLKNYKISTDYSGTNYCGLTFEWNY